MASGLSATSCCEDFCFRKPLLKAEATHGRRQRCAAWEAFCVLSAFCLHEGLGAIPSSDGPPGCTRNAKFRLLGDTWASQWATKSVGQGRHAPARVRKTHCQDIACMLSRARPHFFGMPPQRRLLIHENAPCGSAV